MLTLCKRIFQSRRIIDPCRSYKTSIFDNCLQSNSLNSFCIQASKYGSLVNDKWDICIVGGGIVGLATARELLLRFPSKKIILVEKEKELSLHQSGHNSGVIHAGIYYAPGSLKAKLCVEGLHKTYEYLDNNKLPYKKCGKLIVAVKNDELDRLQNLHERAIKNKVPGVSIVEGKDIKSIEPHCCGLKAIYSSETGIVDWRVVALSYGENFVSMGGKIVNNFAVNEFIESHDAEYPISVKSTNNDRICAKYVITCAGLQSDKVAQLSGCSPVPKIVPFRGDYLKLVPSKSNLVSTNIYPVPDPRFPFLGVHFTPRMDGSVWLGPNAVLSFKREGYGRFDFSLSDTFDALAYSGLRKIAFKHLKFGINEIISGLIISRQVKSLQSYVPSLRTKDVVRGPSGIRAQALDPEGNLVDDFVFHSGEGLFGYRLLHVRNAPSPAATSSLAIASMVADKCEKQFQLH